MKGGFLGIKIIVDLHKADEGRMKRKADLLAVRMLAPGQDVRHYKAARELDKCSLNHALQIWQQLNCSGCSQSKREIFTPQSSNPG